MDLVISRDYLRNGLRPDGRKLLCAVVASMDVVALLCWLAAENVCDLSPTRSAVLIATASRYSGALDRNLLPTTIQ